MAGLQRHLAAAMLAVAGESAGVFYVDVGLSAPWRVTRTEFDGARPTPYLSQINKP